MRQRSVTFLISIIFLTATSCFAAEVKEADLAGSWYSASKAELETQLKSYLDKANPERVEGQVLAVIVPHAGYAFSGPVAAYSYKEVQDREIKTIIVLGFSHRKYFDGIAVYDRGSWRTPLGDIQIDEALAKDIISKNPRIKFNSELFSEENSVEMQIPFIQMALGKMGQSPSAFAKASADKSGTVPIFPKIVPIAFGTQDYGDVKIMAEALAATIKDRNDILIVASTDMSHYHPYTDANSIDQHTINTINRLKAKDVYDEGRLGVCEMCGLMPVSTVLLTADKLGYNNIKILKYANSGDITGDKAKVVGYLSAVIYKGEIVSSPSASRNGGVNSQARNDGKNMLNNVQRKRLLQIARESITSYVRDGKRKQFSEKDPLLNKPLGAFVTLHELGELRGCIGNMVGQGPLYQTIADMAIEAATGDPRFRQLSKSEIDKIEIEISVLSPLKKVNSADEITIPGEGVIVRKGYRSGVYLPQVAAETRWGKEEFLTSLCEQKAGLAPDAWKDPGTELYTFTAEVFGEKGEQHAQ